MNTVGHLLPHQFKRIKTSENGNVKINYRYSSVLHFPLFQEPSALSAIKAKLATLQLRKTFIKSSNP